MKKGTYTVLAAGYVAAVALYLVWVRFGLPFCPLLFALPVLYLAVVSFAAARGQCSLLPVGLLLSAAGDFCGGNGLFLWQASFFAAAHVCYAVYFLRGAWFRPTALVAALVLAAVVVAVAREIVPSVSLPVERVAVVVYTVLITLMCASSFFRKGKYRGWYAAGALLFLVSDAFLAWNRFVAPFGWSGVAVMTAYWSAQALLAGAFLAAYVRRSSSR